MTTGDLLRSGWDVGLVVPGLSIATLAAYGARFGARAGGRAIYFVLAVALAFLALASPIAVLARGYLFSAHMVQHLILLLAVPPLALLGLPRVDGEATRGSALGMLGPWVAGVGAMWLWHVQALCNAAAVSAPVQAVQTASLVAMGVVFWRPVLAPRDADRLPPLDAMVYLFAACVACTLLGILVTFSPASVCSAYANPVDRLGVIPLLREGWGLTPKNDQELGGVLMWVPTCVVYAAAILATLARYYRGEERPALARTHEEHR